MELVYSPKYEVNLGTHPFITSKYRLIKEKLSKEYPNLKFIEPVPATVDILCKVHTEEYINKILKMKLSFEELLKLEIPLTEEVILASLICVNATIVASEIAIKNGVGIHIGGGFHHAYADHGEGFCIFNDIACAIRYLKDKFDLEKFAVVDCDVHQGNGTAKIFENDKSVFTFSIHQKEIYPSPKEKSSLDIEVSAGIKDEEYLSLLKEGLKVVKKFNPDIIFYQAGVDIYENDQLAELKITKEGILHRDKIVYEYFEDKPLVVTLGGGYALDINHTVELHCNTIKTFLKKLETNSV
ncbi:MAG: histone deacetylase [Endomicrobia bacterium]|nr:histone deacetylase [Endomicrobiia bacterium]